MIVIKRTKNKKIIQLLFVIIMMSQPFFGLINVYASAPYRTFTLDGQGNMIETQTAYMPIDRINHFDYLHLDDPQDMIIVDDILYIADTGNNRIVVAELDGTLIRIVGEDVLRSPQGVFVTSDHRIYVADELNEKVHVFSETGVLLEEFGRPDHPLFGDRATFIPQKVVVDNRKNIYVISRGNANGIIQLSQANNGEFLGYFGVNLARTSLMGLVRNLIFTEEQIEQLFPTIPATTTNLSIDSRGLIHTITTGDENEMVKRLNMAGNNILDETRNFPNPTGVVVGPIGNIFVTTANGQIIEYTRDGEVLFIFGGQDVGEQRLGFFNSITAIAIDGKNNLYVLDAHNNEIQVFQRTEFATLAHDALVLYQEGFYQQSKEPWTQVLQMNSLFGLARVGLGEALYYESEYAEARDIFRRGNNHDGYSNAFWDVRNDWLQSNLTHFIYWIVGIVVIWKILSLLDKKKQIFNPIKKPFKYLLDRKLVKELNFIWSFIKRPVDGFYSIRFENKVSMTSTTIWLVIIILIFLVNRYQSGFLFRTVMEGEYNIMVDVAILLGVFLFVTASHYLVATITNGEGKISNVYIGVVHSFFPYILLIPFATILSNVLTLNESFLLSFTYLLAYGWIATLIIIMIKEIHNFSIGEVFKNILLTIFTALLFMLIVFIMYVIIMQFYNFASSIFGEVVNRFGNSL